MIRPITFTLVIGALHLGYSGVRPVLAQHLC